MGIGSFLNNIFAPKENKKLTEDLEDTPLNRNLYEQDDEIDLDYQPTPNTDFPILETKVVKLDDTSQEIVIYYGSKKKKRILYKRFIPKNFAANYIDSPAAIISATNLQSMSQMSAIDPIFRDRFLRALVKVNHLIKMNLLNNYEEINRRILFEASEKLINDRNFASSSQDQKRLALNNDQQNNSYLTQTDKAILIQAINNNFNQKFSIDLANNDQNLDISSSKLNILTKNIIDLTKNTDIILDLAFNNLNQVSNKDNIRLKFDQALNEKNEQKRNLLISEIQGAVNSQIALHEQIKQ